MAEQGLDGRSVLQTLRRHRRVLVIAAVLGEAAGLAFLLARPPGFQSTSMVLLAPETTNGQPTTRDMDTEIRIASSGAVLDPVREAEEPRLSRRELDGRVEITLAHQRRHRDPRGGPLCSRCRKAGGHRRRLAGELPHQDHQLLVECPARIARGPSRRPRDDPRKRGVGDRERDRPVGGPRPDPAAGQGRRHRAVPAHGGASPAGAADQRAGDASLRRGRGRWRDNSGVCPARGATPPGRVVRVRRAPRGSRVRRRRLGSRRRSQPSGLEVAQPRCHRRRLGAPGAGLPARLPRARPRRVESPAHRVRRRTRGGSGATPGLAHSRAWNRAASRQADPPGSRSSRCRTTQAGSP